MGNADATEPADVPSTLKLAMRVPHYRSLTPFNLTTALAATTMLIGVAGAAIWLITFYDGYDGEMRWGQAINNPYVHVREMQKDWAFGSSLVLFICCMLEAIGGLLFFLHLPVGSRLIILQAKAAVTINAAFAVMVAAFIVIWLRQAGRTAQLPLTFTLRCISLLVDFSLWILLTRSWVCEMLEVKAGHNARGFEVVVSEKYQEGA